VQRLELQDPPPHSDSRWVALVPRLHSIVGSLSRVYRYQVRSILANRCPRPTGCDDERSAPPSSVNHPICRLHSQRAGRVLLVIASILGTAVGVLAFVYPGLSLTVIALLFGLGLFSTGSSRSSWRRNLGSPPRPNALIHPPRGSRTESIRASVCGRGQLSGMLDPGRHRLGGCSLATLTYRLASYWLPMLAGPVAYALFRHRYRSGSDARRGVQA
jgi:hypothetical protein